MSILLGRKFYGLRDFGECSWIMYSVNKEIRRAVVFIKYETTDEMMLTMTSLDRYDFDSTKKERERET